MPRPLCLTALVLSGCLGSVYSTEGRHAPSLETMLGVAKASPVRAPVSPSSPETEVVPMEPAAGGPDDERESVAAVERRAMVAVQDAVATGGAAALRALRDRGGAEDRLVFALSRAELGDLDLAREALDRLVADRPEWLPARYALARLLLQLEDHDGAAAQLRAACTAEQAAGLAAHVDGRWLLGRALLFGSDPVAGDRLLREEIATGDRPVPAAYALIAALLRPVGGNHWLASRDALVEVLAVADAVLARRTDRLLRDWRGRALCALNEWSGGVDAYRELVAEDPGDRETRFRFAEALLGAGQLEAAANELAQIDAALAVRPGEGERPPADEALARSVRAALDALRQSVAAGRRHGRSPYELLALLRAEGGDEVRRTTAKRVALEQLTGGPAAASLPSIVPRRAIELAFEQSDAPVRALALRRWPTSSETFAGAARAAIADVDSRVRAVAASRLPDAAGVDAAAILLDAMAGEDDPAAFRAMHEAMCELFGPRVRLAFAAEGDSDQRQAAYSKWREHCSR